MYLRNKELQKKELIQKAPYLEVTLIEGNAIPKETTIKINGLGCIGTSRAGGEDSYVYFGSAKDMNG